MATNDQTTDDGHAAVATDPAQARLDAELAAAPPEPAPSWLTVPADTGPERRIATRVQAAATEGAGGPGIVWLPGFNSTMTSTKASVMRGWTKQWDVALTRFDYFGHGETGGALADGTMGIWIADALATIEAHANGPQILVGSSMGGWVAIEVARALAQRAHHRKDSSVPAPTVAALVLIAPAWDMTERLMWDKFPDAVREEVMTQGQWLRPSAYGDDPYPITRDLIEDGRTRLLADRPFDPGCPVRIIQGAQDEDVPVAHVMELFEHLTGDNMRITIVKDAGHRLSRPQDLALLRATVSEFVGVSRPDPRG